MEIGACLDDDDHGLLALEEILMAPLAPTEVAYFRFPDSTVFYVLPEGMRSQTEFCVLQIAHIT